MAFRPNDSANFFKSSEPNSDPIMTRPNFRKTNDRERTAKIGTKPEIELKFRGTKVGLALEHIVPSFKSDQVKGLNCAGA